MTLVLGIGLYLLDFGTDISFSVDMNNMANRNFSGEISECRGKIVRMNERYEMDCFHSDILTKNFRCLNDLGKLQQEAKRCFERKQHFQDPAQFIYMRNGLKLFNFLISIREGVKVEKKCDNYRNLGLDSPPIISNLFLSF